MKGGVAPCGKPSCFASCMNNCISSPTPAPTCVLVAHPREDLGGPLAIECEGGLGAALRVPSRGSPGATCRWMVVGRRERRVVRRLGGGVCREHVPGRMAEILGGRQVQTPSERSAFIGRIVLIFGRTRHILVGVAQLVVKPSPIVAEPAQTRSNRFNIGRCRPNISRNPNWPEVSAQQTGPVLAETS